MNDFLTKYTQYTYNASMLEQWTSEEIRKFRKRLGLYQKDFAEMIGVTRLYVIYLEKGVRRPSKTLRILLSVLKQIEKRKKKGGNENGSECS